MRTAVALATAALALAACTRDVTVYPSLAPRPVEKLGFGEPEVPVVAVKPDPALDARIATLRDSLDAVTQGFAGDATKAERAATAARGKPVGSDAWLDAQSALAQLDDWRAQTSSLVTDVDQIAADRAATLAPDYPALTAIRDRVAAELDRQGATIDRLQSALPAA